MGFTVADLANSAKGMTGAAASAPEGPEPEGDMEPMESMGAEDEEKNYEDQTMQVLAEEFRSAPVEDAVHALDQLVRMIVRKYT